MSIPGKFPTTFKYGSAKEGDDRLGGDISLPGNSTNEHEFRVGGGGILHKNFGSRVQHAKQN